MSEYTPPMSRLRAEYVQMRRKHYGFADLYAAEFDRALAAHDAQVRAEERERWEEWLFTTNWPFDWNSDVPPPTTAEAMGRIWNERDDWGVTDEEAADAVAAESGIARAESTDSEES